MTYSTSQFHKICTLTYSDKSGWMRLVRISVLALIVILFSFTSAQAQTLSPTMMTETEAFLETKQLKIHEVDESYHLAPHSFMVPDPDNRLSYSEVLHAYKEGRMNPFDKGNIIKLGSRPISYWIVTEIRNNSWNEDWVITLGNNITGRFGQLGAIYLYDDESRTRYVDTINASKNPYYHRGSMMGNAIPVKIKSAQKSLMVMYVTPDAGAPVMIAPHLMSAQKFMTSASSPFSASRMFTGFFAMMVGFYLGMVVLRKMRGGILFALFYAILLVSFQLQNDETYSSSASANELLGMAFSILVILGMAGAARFLGIRKNDYFQNRVILAVQLIVFLSALAGCFVMQPDSLMKPLMLFLPALLGVVFIVLLSLAQGQSGKYAAYQFSASWMMLLVGLIITLLSSTSLFVPNNYTVGAFWISLIPMSLMMVSASITRLMMIENDEILSIEEQKSEEESIALLKQTRETSENARLMRVIEHEREVLAELREREAQQNQEMRVARDMADEASRAKSAFLAVISHEIRTPMSGVMGMVRLLLDTSLSREQRDYAQTIQDSGDAMLSLLNDILDFEKIESGMMELEQIDFDLPRLINGIVTLMSGHVEAKNITLKADMASDFPRFLIGDPVRLRQVILNLAGNAIKFTDRGGVIIHVSAEDSSDSHLKRVHFAIRDTGVGISKEAQKNLFNPFAQADSSVSRRFGGTGLGLAISQRLIESMGGKIAIDSIEGRGSTFHFTLMMEEGSAENIGNSVGSFKAHAQPSKKLSVLVVDDNEITQKLMKEFVHRFGHEVTTAPSGEKALEILGERSFDVALMDMELPGISGIGATKAIRALRDREKSHMPVIAMTGNVRAEDIHKCYAANMNGHIAKPIDPDKLRIQLQKVIDNNLDNPVEVDVVDYTAIEEKKIDITDEGIFSARGLNIEDENLSLDDEEHTSKYGHETGAAPIHELLKSLDELDDNELGDKGAPSWFSDQEEPLSDSDIEALKMADFPDIDNLNLVDDVSPIHLSESIKAHLMDDVVNTSWEQDLQKEREINLEGSGLTFDDDASPWVDPNDSSKSGHETADKQGSALGAKLDQEFDTGGLTLLSDDEIDTHAAPIYDVIREDSSNLIISTSAPSTNDENLVLAINEEKQDPSESEMNFKTAAPVEFIDKAPVQEVKALVFDSKTLDVLKAGLSVDAVSELVTDMIDKAIEISQALRQNIETQDFKIAAMRAHELKGMVGNFGLLEVSQHVAKMEGRLNEEHMQVLKEDLVILDEAMTRANTALQAWLAD
jgi:signal transduction histidine kinase/DNA-binding response OmpR family regulator/HPt (histidine-containing phosphotransfer) domain-containing protein